LTAAQIAAGAWALDLRGRPIDRQGQLLFAGGPTNSAPAYDPARMLAQEQPQQPMFTGGASQRLGQQATFDQRPTSQVDSRGQSASLGTPTIGQPSYSPDNLAYRDRERPVDSYEYATSPRETQQMRLPAQPSPSAPDRDRRELDRVSELDRSREISRSANAIGDAPLRRPVASQSFFNTLLLLSFVANVYLVVWLKKLRLRFHEIVAAKRMANSNGSAS
jgi:hypothetical protein